MILIVEASDSDRRLMSGLLVKFSLHIINGGVSPYSIFSQSINRFAFGLCQAVSRTICK